MIGLCFRRDTSTGGESSDLGRPITSPEEGRRPVAVVSPQQHSPNHSSTGAPDVSKGTGEQVSSSESPGASTTSLPFSVLEVIAEADEPISEENTPQLTRKSRASPGKKVSPNRASKQVGPATKEDSTVKSSPERAEVAEKTSKNDSNIAERAPPAKELGESDQLTQHRRLSSSSSTEQADLSLSKDSDSTRRQVQLTSNSLKRELSKSTLELHSAMMNDSDNDEKKFVVVNLERNEQPSVGLGVVDGTVSTSHFIITQSTVVFVMFSSFCS